MFGRWFNIKPLTSHHVIVLMPYESAAERIHAISEKVPLDNRVIEPVPDLKQMYDDKRDQYNARGYVRHCAKIARREGHLVLGITGVDLFYAGHDFVFGSAQVGGNGGVLSIHRLGEGDELEERMIKEILHEIGHIVGLTHCEDPKCVMYFSNTIEETDVKDKSYCSSCDEEYQSLKETRLN